MSHLFLELPITTETIVLGISMPARWAPGINRAAELLREKHPGADDATILELLVLHGMCDVIDRANSMRQWPQRNCADDAIVRTADEALA